MTSIFRMHYHADICDVQACMCMYVCMYAAWIRMHMQFLCACMYTRKVRIYAHTHVYMCCHHANTKSERLRRWQHSIRRPRARLSKYAHSATHIRGHLKSNFWFVRYIVQYSDNQIRMRTCAKFLQPAQSKLHTEVSELHIHTVHAIQWYSVEFPKFLMLDNNKMSERDLGQVMLQPLSQRVVLVLQ